MQLTRALFARLMRGLSLILLVSVALGVLSVGLISLQMDHKHILDFPGFYAAGRIAMQGTPNKLYSMSLQAAVEKEVAPWEPFIPFTHAPFEALLFAPLTLLPFSWGFVVWDILNLMVFGLSLKFLMDSGPGLNTSNLLVLLCVALPAVGATLSFGQDSLLLLAAITAAFLALKRGRELAAGMLLGLGLFRFEIIVPLVFIFLLRRRFRFLAGLSLTGIVLAVGSFALIGWSGAVDYVSLITSLGRVGGAVKYGQWPEATASMTSLRGLFATLLGGAVSSSDLFLVVAVTSLALVCWVAWEFDAIAAPGTRAFDLQFSLCLVAALLVGYHVWSHELDLLILVAYAVLAQRGPNTAGKGAREYSFLMLLLLIPTFLVFGPVFHFLAFSVLVIPLLGLCAWLAIESRALRSRANSASDVASALAGRETP